MKYLTLGFSIASFLAAGAIALATSARADLGVMRPSGPAACKFASSQDCASANGAGRGSAVIRPSPR